MRASESIGNYDIKVREYTNYAIKSIKNCCKNFAARPTGSENEKKAQEYMMNDLNNFCDEVTREEFKVSDKAFMSWIRIGVVMAILGIAMFTLGFFAVSAAIFFLIILMIALEFGFYKPVLDVFFKKKTAGNVYGVRKAEEDAKTRELELKKLEEEKKLQEEMNNENSSLDEKTETNNLNTDELDEILDSSENIDFQELNQDKEG